MIRHSLLLSTAALVLAAAATPAALTAQAPAASPAPAAPAGDPALAAWFEEYDKASLARSPLSKAYRGIRDGDYGKWDDNSEAGRQADYDAEQAALKEFKAKFDRAKLVPADQLSYDLFVYNGVRRTRAWPFRDYGYAFDQMNGAQSDVPSFLINIHQVTNRAEADAYVARLNGTAKVVDDAIAQARRSQALGIVPPKWVFPYVLSDARNVITGAPFGGEGVSPILEDFQGKVAKLTLPQGEKDALLKAATAALTGTVKPAYDRMIAFVAGQEKVAGTDDGVWRFPNAQAYYAERLANYTTTTLTPDQVHQIGLDNVARIHREVQAIMDQVGFKGNLQQFFQQMRTDKRFYAPNGPAGRKTYLDETEKAKAEVVAKLPQWFGTLPQAPMQVKPVEPFREKSAGKAFYQRPAPDGSRPGVYYVNLYDMADMPLFELEALFYHEGIPGHHLQLAVQTELRDVPPFRRFGGVTAYTEGWGLYAEKLGKDMGQYRDPYRDFGRLQLELHRAIRLVVDTGLHHKRWTREQAIKYVQDNSADAPGGIVKAIERYIVFPGQANAYMIGRLKISELRQRAEKALGQRFDIRAFHDVVLRSGPVPLDMLESRVDAWIATRKG